MRPLPPLQVPLLQSEEMICLMGKFVEVHFVVTIIFEKFKINCFLYIKLTTAVHTRMAVLFHYYACSRFWLNFHTVLLKFPILPKWRFYLIIGQK